MGNPPIQGVALGYLLAAPLVLKTCPKTNPFKEDRISGASTLPPDGLQSKLTLSRTYPKTRERVEILVYEDNPRYQPWLATGFFLGRRWLVMPN